MTLRTARLIDSLLYCLLMAALGGLLGTITGEIAWRLWGGLK